MTYKDDNAMLDHLLDGKALPDHLARSRVGTIVERSPRMREQIAAQQAREAKARAEAAANKLSLVPLVKVCYSHQCLCGNAWQVFGFYARRGAIDDYRAGSAVGMKRIDYRPSQEPVTETIWQTVEEHTCIKCCDATEQPVGATQSEPTPAVLAQYKHMAAEGVEELRQDALKLRNAAYTASAVKRIAAALPYGLEDAIPAVPELVAMTRQASDAE